MVPHSALQMVLSGTAIIQEINMLPQLYFFLSIAAAIIAWGVVLKLYLWPRLRVAATPDALRPILVLHCFRFLGLAFLVPGVVSPDLPPAFAHAAAFGDLIAAILALVSLAFLRFRAGVVLAWIFNLWGATDILNAFFQAGRAGLMAGQLGGAYFLPTFIVPLLLITHVLAFRISFCDARSESGAAQRGPRRPRLPRHPGPGY